MEGHCVIVVDCATVVPLSFCGGKVVVVRGLLVVVIEIVVEVDVVEVFDETLLKQGLTGIRLVGPLIALIIVLIKMNLVP